MGGGGVAGGLRPPSRFPERPPPPPPPTPVAPPEPPPVTVPHVPTELRTDEIHFEPGSARLTNIAKAILDDVALRMKQEPTSTAIVIGYTDDDGRRRPLLLHAQRHVVQDRLDPKSTRLNSSHQINS